jgi:hypothetical protein
MNFKMALKRVDLPADRKIVLILLLLFYFTVLVTVGIGFDLRDEGYYFLGYDRHQNLFFLFSGSHKLIKWLPFSDYITVNRIYRLTLLLLATRIFAKTLSRVFYAGRNHGNVFCWVLLANTISYLFGPASLSYNTLNLFFLQVVFSLVLSIFYISKPISKSSQFVQYIGLAFFLSLLVINKPTSGVLFAALFVLDTMITNKRNLLHGLKAVLIIGIAAATLLCLIFYLMYQGNIQKIIYLLFNNQFYQGDGHLNLAFLFNQIFVKPFTDQKGLLLFSVGYLGIFLLYKKTALGNRTCNVLFIAFTVYCMWYYHKSYYNGFAGSQFIYAYLFFTVLINYKEMMERLRHLDASKRHTLIWLFILPFIGFFGSDVPFYLGVLNVIGFHVLLIFILFGEQNSFGMTSFSLLMVLFAFFVHLFNPYSNPSVFNQRNRISFSKADVFVSDQVYREYLAVKEMVPFISKSDNLINIGTPVGCLYLCDLTSFYTIYFNSVFFNDGYLKLIKNIEVNKRVQLLYNRNTNDVPSYEKMRNDFMTYMLLKGYKLNAQTQSQQYELFTFVQESSLYVAKQTTAKTRL